VLQDFDDRFQDFERTSKIIRLVAFPQLVEIEGAPLHLQMELMKFKDNDQLVKNFKDEENVLDTWKDAVEYPKLQELARKKLSFFTEALT